MRERVIPALRFRALTRFYDPMLAGVLRESSWKAQLVAQVGVTAGMRILDLGCGTGTLTRGELPALVSTAGFDPVRETSRRRTVFGTLTFLLARPGGAR